MARRSKAEDKFAEALDMMHRTGIDPLNYMLSYVMGFMEAKQRDEYVHNFEQRRMTITLSDYDDKPKLTLIKGDKHGEDNVPA